MMAYEFTFTPCFQKHFKGLTAHNSGIIAGSGIGHIRRIAGYNKRKAAKGGTLS